MAANSEKPTFLINWREIVVGGLGYMLSSPNQDLFKRAKSDSEGLKNRNRGPCRIIPVKTSMISRMSSIGAAKVSRVPWTICRGAMKMFYTETIYPPAPIAEHVLKLCKYRAYATLRGGGLCRDLSAQRCYEETL